MKNVKSRLRFARGHHEETFSSTLWSTSNRPDEHELEQIRKGAKSCGYYPDVQTLIHKGCEEKTIFLFAAGHVRFETTNVEAKLEAVSGYDKKAIKALRERCDAMASEIEHLHNIELPGRTTYTALLRKFGGPGQGGLYPVSERFVSDIERLPRILKEYSSTLICWPHPLYRKRLSDKRWKGRWLTILCSYVEGVTGRAHYKEIASLVNSVEEFDERHKARRVLGKRNGTSEINVRKAVANFRRRNSDEWEKIQTKCRLMAERNRGFFG